MTVIYFLLSKIIEHDIEKLRDTITTLREQHPQLIH